MNCEICKRECGVNGIRMGVCYDCVEAESIIVDGTDMHDMVVATTARKKLEAIIKRGLHR